MFTTTRAVSLGTAAVLALSIALASAPAFARGGGGGDRERSRCKAESLTEDASMDAKFERKRGRIKFDASFEAAPGGTNGTLAVLVNGVNVGSMTLRPTAAGDLEGDLEFDSNPDENEPFPRNFPRKVGAGTAVVVGVLGCTLRK